MGVQGPAQEALEEVPTTPSGVPDLGSKDNDLYSDNEHITPPTFDFENDLKFKTYLSGFPVKGVFEDFLGQPYWEPGEKKKYCPECFEDVKRDLKTLASVVEECRSERDVTKRENEILKQEVEHLRNLLKEKEEPKIGDVRLSISNTKEDSIDVLVKRKNFGHRSRYLNSCDRIPPGKEPSDFKKRYGIQCITLSLPHKDTKIPLLKPTFNNFQNTNTPERKKTVAELRREFFEKELQNESTPLIFNSNLEVKPEENNKLFRSRLVIRVKPKIKINDTILKLKSNVVRSKIVPEPLEIQMSQRTEKTRILWKKYFEEKLI